METDKNFTKEKTENRSTGDTRASDKTDLTSPADMAPSAHLVEGRVFADFLDEAACRAHVLKTLHPRGARCPQCDVHIEDATTLNNFLHGDRCVCKKCDAWFTARTGTILQGAQLSFAQIFLLASLVEINATGDADIPVSMIAAAAGISDDTTRTWVRRLQAFNAR